jgi:hypothetical protein
LASTIYQNVFGIKLQRRSKDISRADVSNLSKDELKPGDLVFFATSRRKKGVNHVGVYLGNKRFVHASCSNGVIVSSLEEAYYQRTWVKGGRVKDANYTSPVQVSSEDNKLEIENLVAEAIPVSDVKPPHSIDKSLKHVHKISKNRKRK